MMVLIQRLLCCLYQVVHLLPALQLLLTGLSAATNLVQQRQRLAHTLQKEWARGVCGWERGGGA